MQTTDQRANWYRAYYDAFEPKVSSGVASGPCPVCGGEDRFWIREVGSFGCRGCEPSKSNTEAVKKIAAALNDLAGVSNNGTIQTKSKWEILRAHKYKDAEGRLQVKHVKGIPPGEKKTTWFWQHYSGADRWGRGLGSHKLADLLYARERLTPDVKYVVVLEGEKDADTAHNLLSKDNPEWAFISGGGASVNANMDWAYLSGVKKVCVYFDGDSAGREGVERYVDHAVLSGHLPGVEFCGYAEPGEHGRDISDIYKAFGMDGVDRWFEHIKKLPVKAVGQTPVDVSGLQIEKQVKEFGIHPLPEQLVADWFISEYSDKFRFDTGRQVWLHLCDDGVWELGDAHVLRAISDLLSSHCEDVRGYGSKGYLRTLRSMGGANMRRNVLFLLSSATNLMHTDSDEWDADPELIGTADGVWNLRTLKKLATSEAITAKVTKRTKISPDVKDSKANDRFKQFLVEVSSENLDMASFLLDYLGYMLTGYTHEEKFLFIHGRANNGKSVLLRLVDWVMGEYSHVVPQDEFERKGGSRHPTHETQLDGVRSILLDEQRNLRWDEARLKNVVSGGSITAHKMGKDFYTFQSRCKLLIASNVMPQFSADSAMAKRLLAMNFRFSPTEDQMDKDLFKKLQKIGGRILWTWMQAAQRYLDTHRLVPPKDVVSEANRVMMKADPIKAFFMETYTVSDNDADKIARESMLASYQVWVEEYGMTTGKGKSENNVSRRLGQLCAELEPEGVYEGRVGNKRYWHRLRKIA